MGMELAELLDLASKKDISPEQKIKLRALLKPYEGLKNEKLYEYPINGDTPNNSERC